MLRTPMPTFSQVRTAGGTVKLSVIALASTAGLFWGGAILVVASANLTWPGYGRAFLELAASLYPGYQPGAGLVSVITGTVYGLVDGAVSGAVFAWLYNLFAKRRSGAV
jgi:predicted DNA repair protein MutK